MARVADTEEYYSDEGLSDPHDPFAALALQTPLVPLADFPITPVADTWSLAVADAWGGSPVQARPSDVWGGGPVQVRPARPGDSHPIAFARIPL